MLAGVIPLGTLLVFMRYVRKMQNASGSLFTVFARLKAAEASIDRLMEVLESDEEITEDADARPLPAIRASSGHVVLEAVTCGYDHESPVLENIDLEARPGDVVALVGVTGAGKSTLVSLIPRFIDPWQGRVLLDGVDVRQATLKSLRSRVSIVLQESLLPPLTVAETIAYGRPEASHEDIVAAAIAARADDFVRKLPDGYDSSVGERGSKLSGGERQRLAIARALLRDTPVLILDEPTSALDVQTEAELLAALERLMEGRTTFVIAHRLSTVRHADRIAVLDHGRIVELGTHSALLQQEGIYHRLHAAQTGDAAKEHVA